MAARSADKSGVHSSGLYGFLAGFIAGSKRIEWPTLTLVAACYGIWLLAGIWVYSVAPPAALALVAIAVALHSSLQHEILHGHPTRSGRLNEALVFLPIGLVYPFRRYKHLHLRHHADERLTDPFDDPESYYRALRDFDTLPRFVKVLLRWNNTLVGRSTLGPGLMVVGFLLSEWKAIRAGDHKVRAAWLLHGLGLVPTLAIVVFLFRMPLLAYGVAVYAGLALLAVRSFCEHQWAAQPDQRTVIVERSLLSLLFLNNNLHLVHHKRPTVPWYELPRIYREDRTEWLRLNRGYVFGSYFDVLRAFAFRSKEPVVHPVYGRDPGPTPTPAPARAFRPRRFHVNMHGGASAPIPADPRRE